MAVYVMKNGEKCGPYEESVVAGWLMNGTFSPQELAWRDGMSNWQPLRTIPLVTTRKKSGGAGGLIISALGIITIIFSFLVFIWGYMYVNNHPWGGAASAFGMSDGTYEIAKGAIVVGVLGFLLGLALLISGIIAGAIGISRK